MTATTRPSTTTAPTTRFRSSTRVLEAGYYFCHLKLQPFVRYEFLKYTSDVVNNAKAQQRFGAGYNYYVYGQNLKIVPYFERVLPKSEPAVTQKLEEFNRFLLEVQGSF